MKKLTYTALLLASLSFSDGKIPMVIHCEDQIGFTRVPSNMVSEGFLRETNYKHQWFFGYSFWKEGDYFVVLTNEGRRINTKSWSCHKCKLNLMEQ